MSVTKTCARCGAAKPRTEFHRESRQADGLQNRCKECEKARVKRYASQRTAEDNRRMNLKAFFGLTPEQYDEIYRCQGGRCAICDEEMSKPCLDHCDSTGRIRAMLCHRCNVLLGHVEWVLRDGEFVRKAKAYISAHAAGTLQHFAKYSGLPARVRVRKRA